MMALSMSDKFELFTGESYFFVVLKINGGVGLTGVMLR